MILWVVLRASQLFCGIFSGVFVNLTCSPAFRFYKWPGAFFHCGFVFDVFSSLLIFFHFFRRPLYGACPACLVLLRWVWELPGRGSW